MKRILSLGVLALTALLATEQQAPAWVNFKFSAGINWHWQSGNNMLLWGAWKDGQVPGPEYFHAGGHGHHGAGHYGANEFQYFGAGPRTAPNGSQPASTPTPPPLPPATAQQANYYQPVSYSPYHYNPYFTPNYYPSYWYGR